MQLLARLSLIALVFTKALVTLADAPRPASQPSVVRNEAHTPPNGHANGAPVAPPVRANLTATVAPTAMPLITLELARAEIVDALRMIASQGELNLVIGPEVAGAVSVSLTRVPVDAALQAVAVGNGFSIMRNGDIVTVSKPKNPGAPGAGPNSAAAADEIVPDMKTRVFRPRSVSAADLRPVLEPVLSKYRDRAGRPLASAAVLNEDSRPGYGIATLDGGSGSSGSGGFSPQPTTGNQGGQGGQIATPGASANGAASLTSSTTGATVQASQVLVITDTPEKLAEISRLIDELDRPPKQVLIEARIVEMKLSLQKQLGIDWNIEVSTNGPLLQDFVPLYTHHKLEFAHDTGGDYRPSLGTVDFTRFTAVLRANQDNGGVRLLANPRLLVFNNHRSGILVGERYPILRTTITDQGTATESFEQYIPVGIQLSVTPTILADNRVSLLVHPATTALGDDVVGSTGLRVARILTREVDTRVLIRDGQTVVLGGLIADRRDSVQRKVPGLGDIPILNWLARQERRNDERVDLLVFLTVRIDGAEQIDERDQEVYDTYRPHFKRVTSLKDAALDFELPGFDQNGVKGNGEEFVGEGRAPAGAAGASSMRAPASQPTQVGGMTIRSLGARP